MDVNTITAICSVIIATVALFVAVWQAIASRRHNKLSVKPHLTFTRDIYTNGSRSTLILTNTGVGLAYLKSFKIKVHDESFSVRDITVWEKVVKKIGLEFPVSKGFSCSGDDVVLSPDHSFTLLEIDTPNYKRETVINALHSICIDIEYECMYGSKFSAQLQPGNCMQQML